MNCPAQSSGLKTADAVILAAPGRLYGVTLNPAAADSTLIVYDNASAASGTALAKIFVKASTTGTTIWLGENGIAAGNGLYADVTGASAEYIVYFTA